MFEHARFIKADIPFVPEYRDRNPAPLFRRKFVLGSFQSAKLYVCALGFGYYWINGEKVTEDIHTAPTSDYNKTLWYNVYDVTHLLKTGENVIAIVCGNGWYNETFKTPWNHNKAPWRDNPKFILTLIVDDEVALVSDSSWKCTDRSPILFNQLRSGEYFDARLYDKDWNTLSYDDSDWSYAIIDSAPPGGKFREYPCQPVRECDEYKAKTMIKTGENRYLFDIGQNISGYVRLRIRQKWGDEITIRYAEQINPDYTLQLNNMDRFYPESPFQTDKFICNGEEFIWSPLFTYHGFRYIELTGVTEPDTNMVSGIFVHLDVQTTSSFECSNTYLNRLFRMGQMSTLSNLHYIPTDCPTREKLGWANDAQASAEQMIINFDTVRFFKKWLVDIEDSMREDGAIPGIIPTSGWGYEWGAGPVSSGVLFEIPYLIYLYTGDDECLKEYLPAFLKHLSYIKGRADESGLIGYGLCDWAGPWEPLDGAPTPVEFTDTVLYIKCLKIAILAAERAGNQQEAINLRREKERITRIFMDKYLNEDGTCKVHEQTAVAMLIYHGIYESLQPLKEQLKKTVEERDFHHNCGMVGLRHLYDALNICGLQEYAYRIITAAGYPSYSTWVEGDATTLWETWQPGNSKNHHMYSHFMAWMMKTLVGINPVLEAPGFAEVNISPVFIADLDFCRGYCDTVRGRIEVSWERNNDTIALTINIPEGVKGYWRNNVLQAGQHKFVVYEQGN
ncbi:MAG: family 78 glycoside hydrolase catalytic domain [Clostridiales bacterium]|jgi:alpha-L-rhamnosidase|nr:family 78 glycoside hydrolase catalytic domain [Clostridiales bacterium]